MKKLVSILCILTLLLPAAIAEQETAAPQEDTAGALRALYEEGVEETLEIDDKFAVNISDVFTITMPAGWKQYQLSDTQIENGVFLCYGDGTHFMTIRAEEDNDSFENVDALGIYINNKDEYINPFSHQFGGADFVLYDAPNSSASECVTRIPGKGIFTFSFFPSDGNTEFAQTVIEIMSSFTLIK